MSLKKMMMLWRNLIPFYVHCNDLRPHLRGGILTVWHPATFSRRAGFPLGAFEIQNDLRSCILPWLAFAGSNDSRSPVHPLQREHTDLRNSPGSDSRTMIRRALFSQNICTMRYLGFLAVFIAENIIGTMHCDSIALLVPRQSC